MGWSVLIYESAGRYTSFSMADLHLYDAFKDTLSSERGKYYGMKFVGGRRDIPDEEMDGEVERISGLVDRLNRGEKVDLEAEGLSS